LRAKVNVPPETGEPAGVVGADEAPDEALPDGDDDAGAWPLHPAMRAAVIASTARSLGLPFREAWSELGEWTIRVILL
jgi:hypothetical protein